MDPPLGWIIDRYSTTIIHPWYLACSSGASLRIPVVAIEAGMDTSLNKGK